MIDTREELIGALHQAAEIEHGLMIQYLFPALSMRKRDDEGLEPRQLALARRWEGVILGVAVEEMGHLGTVCNLLAAVGDGPRFDRPNGFVRGTLTIDPLPTTLNRSGRVARATDRRP